MLIEDKPNVDKEEETEPSNFNEAWYHPDPIKREKWRQAIMKEFDNMDTRKVWKVIDREKMPKDR